jgi:hypothetical protein
MVSFDFDRVVIDIKCDLYRNALIKNGVFFNGECGHVRYNCGKNKKTVYIDDYSKLSYNAKNNTVVFESDLFDDDLHVLFNVINNAVSNNCVRYELALN